MRLLGEPRRLLLVLGIGAMALPSAAAGAIRLGPDLSTPLPSGGGHTGSIGCQEKYSPCAYLNFRSTNSEVTVASPVDGVITSWGMRAGCCTEGQTVTRTLTLETYKPGSLDGSGGAVYAVPELAGPSFEIPAGNQVLADTPLELPARVPIKAGERFGVLADYPIEFAVYENFPGVTSTQFDTGYTFEGQAYGGAFGFTLALSAQVEPDADHDGYGDETQDCQPADPLLHGTECVPPPAPVPLPTSLPVGSSSCGSNCGSGPTSGVVFTPVLQTAVPSGDGTHVYLALQCPATAVRACGGFLVIVPGGATKAAAVKRTRYSVAPGKTTKVKIALGKTLLKKLRRAGHLKVTIRIEPTGGKVTSIVRRLKLKHRSTR